MCAKPFSDSGSKFKSKSVPGLQSRDEFTPEVYGEETMTVCIGGMHRSGTSMVARLLQECGLYLGPGRDLLPATPDNADGYMENKKFVGINDEILVKLGGWWGNPPTLSAEWLEGEESRDISVKALALVQEFELRAPWGWKDPRNSITLPFWVRLCPDVRVVVCLRHPLEVARSLRRASFADPSLNMILLDTYPRLLRETPARHGKLSARPLGLKLLRGINQLQVRLSPRKREYYARLLGLTLWRIYNERILEAVPARRRIVTHYDSYFRDPRAELDRVLCFLNMRASEEDIIRCCSLVSERMRHQRSASGQLSVAGLPEEVSNLYRRMYAEAGLTER